MVHSTHFHVTRREKDDAEDEGLLLLPSVAEELEDARGVSLLGGGVPKATALLPFVGDD
jgi:hypothetical protein